MKEIDARGLTCPEPVIITKRALKENPDEIVIYLDNESSKLNVERFLKVAGYQVKIDKKDHEYTLSAVKQ
jgi:TusA-related sulfurtransferase